MNEGEPDEQRVETVSRRAFLERAFIGVGALSAAGVAGSAAWVIANSESSKATPVEAAGDHSQHAPSTGGTQDQQAGAPATHTAEEMDEAHKQGIDDFLRNQTEPLTKGKGGVPLEYTVEDGVKVFRLTCDEIEWEVSPGKVVAARGYNKMVPGPVIRATEGDRVRVIVTNNLTESTTVHWHGIYVPNSMDGVPFLNQPPIRPGETFTYEFTLRNSGTHMYHSHHNSMDQVNRGLLGAFIVDPKDPSTYPAYDREYIMVLNDLALGFTINGKGFPATEALTAKLGERVLVRFLNEGVMNHPMHLHGMPMLIVAKDGWPMSSPQLCDTIDVAPGNRYDAIIEATEPGAWAFHCHVLSHAEGPQGMFGLVTVMLVE